ncbi:MAG: alkaline phosphatase D family protein [Cyclobacteriaceae bacterium]
MARSYLYLIPLFLLLACKATDQQPVYSTAEIFQHGVASGDPLQDKIIIWTRISSPHKDSIVAVEWEMARDDEFKIPVQKGVTSTSSEKDFTVKIDVTDLRPSSTYYYRFKALGTFSQTGRTRTAVAGDTDSLRFAVVSCSNYEWGYFNAYRHIARQRDLMAVIHLGDYIYEYGPGVYGDTTIGRVHSPAHEILTLSDYRQRYAQYRSDPDLQIVHQQHPFITIWDDHEIANNAYSEGAQNHQPDEGEYSTRKDIAKQVYYEWMPVREGPHLYRSFDFGRMASLIMLDERLAGRSMPAEDMQDSVYSSTERAILGDEQFRWFTGELIRSRSRWKILGNQVIFSRLRLGTDDQALNMDAWDGYPVEQERVGKMLSINQFDNLIILTGDTHSSWAFESTLEPGAEQRPLAIELGTTSINSANQNESNPDSVVRNQEELLLSANPHLKFVNLRDHGYILLTLKQDKARADFYYTPTNRERTTDLFLAKQIWIKNGTYKLYSDAPPD